MATKKTTSKSKKKTANTNYKSVYEQQQKSKRQISAIILFTVGVLIASIAFIPGANVWRWLHNTLFGLFGLPAVLIPVALIYIAIMATLDKPIGQIKHKMWQTGILIALVCGLFEIFQSEPYIGTNFFNTISELFSDGVLLKGGGFFSAVIGWPLFAACGKTGAVIIMILFLFAFIMLLTGTTLIGFFKGMYTPVKKIEETYAQRREEIESKANAKNKFDIDIDLGPTADDKQELPQHPVSSPKPTLEEILGIEKEEKERLKRKELDKQKAKKAESKIRESGEQLDELIKRATSENSTINIPLHSQDSAITSDTSWSKVSENMPEFQEDSSTQPQSTQPQSTQPPSAVQQSPQANTSDKQGMAFDVNEQSKLYTDSNNTLSKYNYPPAALLKPPQNTNNRDVSEELKANAALLVDTLKSFGVQTRVIDISRGPTVTRYELQPSAGVKISKITGLADDIALNLASAGVRIEAPIPNKAAVGIEVPNKVTDIVTMREMIDSKEFVEAKSGLSMALGRDIAGNCIVSDIAKMPHVLIAGATGSGKSVCINSIIMSILYKASPNDVRLLMIDPKVVELGVYNGIPHLLVPVVTDPRKAAGALGWAVTEMLNRYKLFADSNVRDIKGYNVVAKNNDEMDFMPQIVIIIDELADLMMAAPNEVEDSICRLAQMARAAGMHLVIATQRPSVDVITGVIKANIPSRIAFAVSSQVDSRTILDSGGAEKLLGRGDMLFYPVGMPKPLRVQGCFVSDKEVEQVVEFIKNKETADYDDKIIEEIDKNAVAEKSESNGSGGGFDDSDDLLQDAIECVLEAGQASTSYLQRKLKVGYARAARLIDDMEAKGIVGAFEGSKPRQILISRQQWIEMRMNNSEE